MPTIWPNPHTGPIYPPYPTPQPECTLTPSATALTPLISAILGSVMNGVANGGLVAFMTGWLAFLALPRIILSGAYMLYHSVTDTWGPGRPPDKPDPSFYPSDPESPTTHLMADYPRAANPDPDPEDAPPPYSESATTAPVTTTNPPTTPSLRATLWPPPSTVRNPTPPPPPADSSTPNQHRLLPLSHTVTPFGWVAWCFTALYSPLAQILWLATTTPLPGLGGAKLMKGVLVGVTALPLCIDCKVRYGESAGKWTGREWVRRGFNLVTAGSCALQGVVGLVLTVEGFVELGGGFAAVPVVLTAVVYPVVAWLWMLVSLYGLPMRDGGRGRVGEARWWGYVFAAGVGAFAGLVVAQPALVLYLGAGDPWGRTQASGMENLRAYLGCQPHWWKKLAVVLP